MIDAIRAIKPWQIAVLVAALFAGLGAVYGVYALVSESEQAGLSGDQQRISVTRGDLVNSVSINGSLAFPNRDALSFGVEGTVGELLVEEGQRVNQGEPLATLDPQTTALLEKAVAQAEVSLRDAENALAKAKDPHTPLDVAQAEANVANARLTLDDAQEVLSKLLEPTPQDVAEAEAKAANANLTLDDAQEALSKLLEPAPQEIAKAEAEVANTNLTLDNAQETLSKLLEPTPQDIAQAKLKATDARVALSDAQEALAEVLEPGPEVLARAEAALTDANISVEEAQEALEEIKNGPADEEIASTQSEIDSASTNLSNAQRDLELTQKEWDGNLEDTQDAAETALEDYQAVFDKWLAIELDGDTGSGPDALLESWGADLTVLFDPDLRFDDLSQWPYNAGLPGDDPATPWSEALIYTWLNLAAGEIVATCEDGVVPPLGACIRKEMDDAWDTYLEAKDNLDTIETQAAKAISNAELAVTRSEDSLSIAEDGLAELSESPNALEIESREKQLELTLLTLQTAEDDLSAIESGPDQVELEDKEAQVALDLANLEEAEGELAELINGPDPLAADAAERQVEVAQANLGEAERELTELMNGPDPLVADAAERQVEVAQANLGEAERELTELMNGPDPLVADAAERQVEMAQASLDEAEEELAELKSSVDPLEVGLRQAEVAAAKAAVETALKQLEDATIKAPWDGIVTAVNVDEEQAVNANTAVVEVVDPSVIEVDGIVDEIDVLFVREGAEAIVTMDALPVQTLEGIVSEIARSAQSQQGVVSYPMTIRVQAPEELELPEGLSAVANVVIREDRDVLLIPLQALYGSFEQPIVRVMDGEGIEEREVALGNNDGYWVVVTEGLVEGDDVVMEAQQATTQGFGGFRGLIGGGFGGPGGFGAGQRPPNQPR